MKSDLFCVNALPERDFLCMAYPSCQFVDMFVEVSL